MELASILTSANSKTLVIEPLSVATRLEASRVPVLRDSLETLRVTRVVADLAIASMTANALRLLFVTKTDVGIHAIFKHVEVVLYAVW